MKINFICRNERINENKFFLKKGGKNKLIELLLILF